MITPTRLHSLLAASLLSAPLLFLAGCSDPPITGPGGGPSSGAAGSTTAHGNGASGPGSGGDMSNPR